MYKITLLLLIFFLVSLQSFALKWAETADSYLLIKEISETACESCGDEDEDSSKLIVIDKNTHAKKSLRIGDPRRNRHIPSAIAVYNNMAYITFRHSHSMAVIDLNQFRIENTVRIEREPYDIVILDGIAYIRHYDALSAVDLSTFRTIYMIATPFDLKLELYKGNIYGISSSQGLFHLNKQARTFDRILLGLHFKHAEFQGNVAYVLGDSQILKIEISTKKVIASTGNAHEFTRFYLVDDHAVAITKDKRLYEIDLNTLIPTEQVDIKDKKLDASTFKVLGTLGYIYKIDKYTDLVCTVIDLTTYRILGKRTVATSNDKDGEDFNYPDFYTNTHAYVNGNKMFPLFPTKHILQGSSRADQLMKDLRSMNPKAFNVSEVQERDYPMHENGFDFLPPYALAQNLFWDLDADKPLMDPVDILATLITMKYPQRFLKTEAGQWLRPRLHMAFFQEVWFGRTKNAQAMLKYFIQLKDPVITRLTKSILTNVPGYKDAEDEETPSTSSSSTSSSTKKRKKNK